MANKSVTASLLVGSFLVCSITAQAQSGPCQGDASIHYNGLEYALLEMGNQCWFAQDLATTNFYTGAALRDGGNGFIINTSTGSPDWSSGVPGYVMGANMDARLVAAYNAAALSSGKLCPQGWHVATQDDWDLVAAHSDFSANFETGEWGWLWDTDYATSFGVGESKWGVSTESALDVIGTHPAGQITSIYGGASARCVKNGSMIGAFRLQLIQ